MIPGTLETPMIKPGHTIEKILLAGETLSACVPRKLPRTPHDPQKSATALQCCLAKFMNQII